jgi:hypothetical protein
MGGMGVPLWLTEEIAALPRIVSDAISSFGFNPPTPNAPMNSNGNTQAAYDDVKLGWDCAHGK